MTDRDLLELAAKAAGLSLSDGAVWDDERADYVSWNPLTDDGDALRLAVRLRLCVLVKTFPHAVVVEAYNGEAPASMETLADVRFDAGDPLAATRRAIVRAAAEIGKGMK